MLELTKALRDFGFEEREPLLTDVATWTTRGLTAYDAVYIALAEEQNAPLLTDDELILEIAGDGALPLALWRSA